MHCNISLWPFLEYAVEILERRKFIALKNRSRNNDNTKIQTSLSYSDEENVNIPEMRLE